MALRTRGVVLKPNAKLASTATMVVGKKRSSKHLQQADPINLEDNSSYHQGSFEAKSYKKDDKAFLLADHPLSWPKPITLFDRMTQKLVERYSEEAHKVAQELAKVNKMTKELKIARSEMSSYEDKLAEMARDRDDALGKLQRTIEDTSVLDPFKNVINGKIVD